MEIIISGAVTAQQKIKDQEAYSLFTAFLQIQPNYPAANHNMGILAVSVGQPQQALAFFKTAADSSPIIDQYGNS